MGHIIRTEENSKFQLHKTDFQDWYLADEVDGFIDEMRRDLDKLTKSLEKLRKL